MSITGIQNNAYVSQLNPASSSVRPSMSGGDGDNDGGGIKKGGALSSAINQALSQSGISSSSGTGTDQAIQAFIQNLLAALQAQQNAQAVQAQNGAAASNAVAGHGHHHGIGKLDAGLQSLIQQLSSSGSGGQNSTNAALQQSFQSLISSNGSNSQTSLSSFLQSVMQNVQGAGLSGNFVNSKG